MLPPCTGQPGYLQPGENPDWATHPDTVRAVQICLTACPLSQFRACAETGLTAGTVEWDKRRRVADGVVMAGIVCKGDSPTSRALRNAAGPLPATAPATRWCVTCRQPMTTRHKPLQGFVEHEGGGQCRKCRHQTRKKPA